MNVVPFLEHLAGMVQYDLGDSDMDALRFGLAASDSDATPPRWYDYEFVGQRTARFRVGREVGTAVVMVEVDLPDDLAERLSDSINLMACYTLTRELP